jgi:hypothetical protein
MGQEIFSIFGVAISQRAISIASTLRENDNIFGVSRVHVISTDGVVKSQFRDEHRFGIIN